MKAFFLVVFGVIAFVSTAAPIPSVSDYSSAAALVNYLGLHKSYYYPQSSLFFQSGWYIEWDQAQNIIAIMDNIYYKYGINGIFLVLSNEAQILDLSGYTASFLSLLESNGIFYQANAYTIVLYYIVGYEYPWTLQISIGTGGVNAEHYLSASSCQSVMDKWGKTLKYYTYENVVNFMADIEGQMDSQANWDSTPTVVKVVIIVVVVIVVIIAAVLAFIFRRVCGCYHGVHISEGPGATTNQYGNIQVTTGTY